MSNDAPNAFTRRTRAALKHGMVAMFTVGTVAAAYSQFSCGGCPDVCSVTVTSTLECISPTPLASEYRPGCGSEPQIDVVNDCAEMIRIGGSREVEPGESTRINFGDHDLFRGEEEFTITSEEECE